LLGGFQLGSPNGCMAALHGGSGGIISGADGGFGGGGWGSGGVSGGGGGYSGGASASGSGTNLAGGGGGSFCISGLNNCKTAYNVGAGYVTIELLEAYAPPAASANQTASGSPGVPLVTSLSALATQLAAQDATIASLQPPVCMPPGGDRLLYNGTAWVCACMPGGWSGTSCDVPPSPPPPSPPSPPPPSPPSPPSPPQPPPLD
jgi:hypothetical protein